MDATVAFPVQPILKSILAFTFSSQVVNTFAQAMPPAVGDTFGIANQAEHLGVVGVLALAVFFLWRSLQSERGKNDARIELERAREDARQEQLIKAMTMTIETNRELRGTVQDSVRAQQELANAISELRLSLGVLPCVEPTVRDLREGRRGKLDRG